MHFALVHAHVISLGHARNMQIVAEGVETEEQSKLQRLLCCDHQRGFLHSEAGALERIAALLALDGPTSAQ